MARDAGYAFVPQIARAYTVLTVQARRLLAPTTQMNVQELKTMTISTGDVLLDVLAAASTAEVEVRKEIGSSGKGGNVAAAQAIGKRIAEKAKAAGVDKVAFDRAGFAYHGRVKALADAAREAGLQF